MSHRICIEVESADRDRFQLAADREGRSVADWLRRAAEVRWSSANKADPRRPLPPDTWERMLGSSHERDSLSGRDGRWGLGRYGASGDDSPDEA